MDVYNDEKENEEGRGSNEEHERGGDIRGGGGGGDKEPDRTDEGTLRRARPEGRKRGGS